MKPGNPTDRGRTRDAQFRPAEENDFRAICALIGSAEELFLVYPRGSYPLTDEQLRHLASTRRDLTVATRDESVLGFANLYDFQSKKSAFIGNVIIGRQYRGCGVGRALVAHMIDCAFHRHELPEVRVSVFSHNVPALLLYTAFGFAPTGVEQRKDFAGNRVALIHMQLKRADERMR